MVRPHVMMYLDVSQQCLQLRRNPKLVNALPSSTRRNNRPPPPKCCKCLHLSKAQVQEALCLVKLGCCKIEITTYDPWSCALIPNSFNQFGQQDLSGIPGLFVLCIGSDTVHHPNRNPCVSNHHPGNLQPGCAVGMFSKLLGQGSRWKSAQQHDTCMRTCAIY